MRKLLLICPTKGRPHRAKEMLDSVKNTSSCDIIFIIDDDEKLVSEYIQLSSRIVVLSKEETLTTKINKVFNSLKNEYQYFSLTNDDFVYHTPQWDDKLIKVLSDYGHGIAYGNDLLQGQRMPVTSIISGEIVRALGWLQLPALKHLYGDDVWKFIGQQLNILYYVPEVVIEHKHWIKDRSLIDETYKKTNSSEMYNYDRDAFEGWKKFGSEKDIETIRSLGV